MEPVALTPLFRDCFGANPDFHSVAPGRVNLIGEHTDYNAGFVLPVAIDRSIVYAVRARDDRNVEIVSREFGGVSRFSLDAIDHDADQSWADYVRGVAWVLSEEGFPLRGFDAVVGGDVPVGAGLSSSAAMEVGAAMAFARVSELDIEPTRLALLCQKAENRFVGVNCGIMDQFISRLGKRDHALFLDCRDLRYEHVPLPLADARLVITNTNVKRSLVTSEYNARRAECERGVELMRAFVPGAQALRDIPADVFALHRDELPELTAQRCGYVIEETARVEAAVAAFRSGNLDEVGRLMLASHEGLRDGYEVSCPELDALVELAMDVPGVYGARMTGAGFGGCTVALLRESAVEPLRLEIAETYPARTGLTPDCYVCQVDDGARIVTA
ncbi:galactokinase [Candidatus Poribacteria bacterium]|nr:galactokinase [Candidatus Poribacteria bacterium]